MDIKVNMIFRSIGSFYYLIEKSGRALRFFLEKKPSQVFFQPRGSWRLGWITSVKVGEWSGQIISFFLLSIVTSYCIIKLCFKNLNKKKETFHLDILCSSREKTALIWYVDSKWGKCYMIAVCVYIRLI